MRILLDECVPWPMRHFLAGHDCTNVQKQGWKGTRNGALLALAASEFDLLKVFAEHPNRPLMRDWLLEVTSHRDMDAFDRAIDLRITRLRRKIEVDPANPLFVQTVRGIGYRLVVST